MNAIADAFLAELARRRGEMTVDVTSAQALTKTQVTRLTEKLNQTLAAKVGSTKVSIRACWVALSSRSASQLIDSSIRTKLVGRSGS